MDCSSDIRKSFEKISLKLEDYLRDSSFYNKNVILILFLRYLSDLNKLEGENSKYLIDGERNFDFLVDNIDNKNIFKIFFDMLIEIDSLNGTTLNNMLEDIFRDMNDLNNVKYSEVIKKSEEFSRELRELIEDFGSITCNIAADSENNAGKLSNNIIRELDKYKDSVKKFDAYTPDDITELISRIVEPGENDTIYDPSCGISSILIGLADNLDKKKVKIYGQEVNEILYRGSIVNTFLNGINNADIKLGDTIYNPMHIDENGNLRKFDIVVGNPPYGMINCFSGFKEFFEAKNKGKFVMDSKWDKYGRFNWSEKPTGRGEMPFIQHMLKCLADDGIMAALVPHGILFRGFDDKVIRKAIIENNYLDAVIGLPSAILYSTSIQFCLMIFKKNRTRKDVLFVDASRIKILKIRGRNLLSEENINEIADVYHNFREINKFSSVVTIDEIRENEYNFNILKYVNIFDKEKVDIENTKQKIELIKKKIDIVDEKIIKGIEDLGL